MNLPPGLWDIKQEIEAYARAYGLDFFETIFELVDYNTMNEIAAFGGFPTRYNHWRFGMEYEQLSKSYEYGLSKIYEMVINNNPAYAYLLEGNNLVDQKTVIAHVYGHVDFFKNNFSFAHTNRKMVDEMANHATRVRRYIDRFGLDKVEDFIETCLSLDNLIDYQSAYFSRPTTQRDDEELELNEMGIPKLPTTRDYMDNYINPAEYLEAQRKKLETERAKKRRVPEHPQKDVLKFLLDHAPLERWESDVLSITREEAYYFAPQAQTKVMNEGWACIIKGSLIFSTAGLVPIETLIEHRIPGVSDGETTRSVYDHNIIPNHPTVTARTRRGLQITGSNNHRVLLDNGEWCRLDALAVGSKVKISGGAGLWPTEELPVSWQPRQSITFADIAQRAGVSAYTVYRFRQGKNIRQADSVAAALQFHQNDLSDRTLQTRQPIQIPTHVNESLAAFLGYMVGDGHISRVKRSLGLTTGDQPQADHFCTLAHDLFGISPKIKSDHSQNSHRLRVLLSAENLSDFLTDYCGLTDGPSAHFKKIPELILRSPAHVVRAFIRALFDCDGYAGEQGVILSTSSIQMSEQVQLVLMNDGILSRRRLQSDGCWHIHVAGISAQKFAQLIGFRLERKQSALNQYLQSHQWFKAEKWDDEIVSLEHGQADVYDISVRDTHRYAACGFINHNSFWHSKILTEKALKASEIIDYAEAFAGVVATSPGQLNPYKLGIELFRDIEERWNRGQFGKEWDECDSLEGRADWDRQLGLGRKKLFEVRSIYNDITFIDEFLTEDFCRRHKLFTFAYNQKTADYQIASRDFKAVKHKLLFQLTNFGQPFIYVKDGNFKNRAELLLHHKFDGMPLRLDYARDVLANLYRIWKRPVNIETRIDNKGRLLTFDGSEHREQTVDYEPI